MNFGATGGGDPSCVGSPIRPVAFRESFSISAGVWSDGVATNGHTNGHTTAPKEKA